MTSLTEKIVLLHQVLAQSNIPHAFGGALALAWCTQQARGTVDIDINIFVSTDETRQVLDALPVSIAWNQKDEETMHREGQVRLWWEKTPIDIFLNTTKLHKQMARRCRWESFAGGTIPFLSCQDIAILKVFFNRTKDWADLEAMQAAGTLDCSGITATIIEYLGIDDERIEKIQLLDQ
jgi:hypothetical protein